MQKRFLMPIFMRSYQKIHIHRRIWLTIQMDVRIKNKMIKIYAQKFQAASEI